MKKAFYLFAIAASMTIKVQAQTGGEPQSINITNINVYAKDSKLILDWATDGTVAANYWEVQRSTDGIQFSTVSYVLGPDSRQEGDKYQYMEKIKNNTITASYYRLKHTGKDGKEIVSEIVEAAK